LKKKKKKKKTGVFLSFFFKHFHSVSFFSFIVLPFLYYFSSLLPFFAKLYDKELLRPFPHFLSIICLFLSLSKKKATSRSPATTSHSEMMPMICLLLFLFVYFPFNFRLPF